jgi:hypothetical protein
MQQQTNWKPSWRPNVPRNIVEAPTTTKEAFRRIKRNARAIERETPDKITRQDAAAILEAAKIAEARHKHLVLALKGLIEKAPGGNSVDERAEREDHDNPEYTSEAYAVAMEVAVVTLAAEQES